MSAETMKIAADRRPYVERRGIQTGDGLDELDAYARHCITVWSDKSARGSSKT